MRLFRKYDFYISEAQSEDYPILANIHDQGFEFPWSEDELAATVAGKGTICYIAKLRGRGKKGPKGFMIVRTLAGQSEVLTIATDPDFRKFGMARALMEHTIRQLQSERIGQLFLEVSETNLPALKLYQSLKFKPISKRKAYYRSRSTSSSEKANGNGDAVTNARTNTRTNAGGDDRANALVMQLELR